MKFDVILINPPFGSVGGDVLHLKFIDKCLELANKQVAIFPFGFVIKVNHKPSKKYKESFDRYLETVEEVSSTVFSSTKMQNIAIYVFDVDKKPNSKITIQRLSKDNNQEVNSLLDISDFDDYEKEIIKYLSKQGQQDMVEAGQMNKRNKQLTKIPKSKHQEYLNNNIIQSCNKLKQKLSNNETRFGLIVNMINGGMNGKTISSRNGQIYNSYKDFVNLFLKLQTSSGYNIILFNSEKSAQNCKIALQNPLLRFTFCKTQHDQHMGINRVYKYIPAIDWSDDRVKTDEGLLEVCGCPKDKCKEYAEYCRKVIEEVDKK